MDVSYSRDTYHTYMIIERECIEAQESSDCDCQTEESTEITYEEKILSNIQDLRLLPFHVQFLNAGKSYYYDITGKIELTNFLNEHLLSADMLRHLLIAISAVCRTLDEYLLNMDALLLTATNLYVDTDMKQVYMAYVPGQREDFVEGLCTLSAFLLEKADHTEAQCVMLVYGFYKTMRASDFNLTMLSALTKEEEKKENQNKASDFLYQQEREDTEEQGTSSVQKKGLKGLGESRDEDGRKDEKRKEKKMENKKWKPSMIIFYVAMAAGLLLTGVAYKLGWIEKALQAVSIDIQDSYIVYGIWVILAVLVFYKSGSGKKKSQGAAEENEIWGEMGVDICDTFADVMPGDGLHNVNVPTDDRTVLLSGDDRTVVLAQAAACIQFKSLNRQAAPDIIIKKLPCTLGSRKGESDIVIEAPGISRHHAVISMNPKGEIQIKDLHSTNGTAVNGEYLEADENRILKPSDLIAMADCKYRYENRLFP